MGTHRNAQRSLDAVMSAVFVCLLNHANHDLSSQTARRTQYLYYQVALQTLQSLPARVGTREHARTHEVDTSAANYGTSTSLFDIIKQPQLDRSTRPLPRHCRNTTQLGRSLGLVNHKCMSCHHLFYRSITSPVCYVPTSYDFVRSPKTRTTLVAKVPIVIVQSSTHCQMVQHCFQARRSQIACS